MKILLLFLFTVNAMAGVCFEKGKKYGSSYNEVITQTCLEQVEKLASSNQKQSSDSNQSEQWMSIGYANILIARKLKPMDEVRDNVIAGNFSHLENITATAIDPDHREIYALDSAKKAIFVYNATLPGNVGPVRSLLSDDLIGAVSISIDSSLLVVQFPDKVRKYDRVDFKAY